MDLLGARALVCAACCLALPSFAQDRDTHARSLAATCANCHGTNGVSVGGISSLAGMSRGTFIRSMQEFRAGRRPATVMQQLARGYDDAEITAMAEWFAKQPPPR